MNLVALLRSQARRYHCPVCSRSMADCDIAVLVQEGSRALVRVTCSRCHDENLFQIVFQPEDIADEPISDAPPIASDELLDLHSLLGGHSGDLLSLIAPNSSSQVNP